MSLCCWSLQIMMNSHQLFGAARLFCPSSRSTFSSLSFGKEIRSYFSRWICKHFLSNATAIVLASFNFFLFTRELVRRRTNAERRKTWTKQWSCLIIVSSERTGNGPAARKGDWSGAESQLIPTGIPAEKELFRFRFYYLKSPHNEIAKKNYVRSSNFQEL